MMPDPSEPVVLNYLTVRDVTYLGGGAQHLLSLSPGGQKVPISKVSGARLWSVPAR